VINGRVGIAAVAPTFPQCQVATVPAAFVHLVPPANSKLGLDIGVATRSA